MAMAYTFTTETNGAATIIILLNFEQTETKSIIFADILALILLSSSSGIKVKNIKLICVKKTCLCVHAKKHIITTQNITTP